MALLEMEKKRKVDEKMLQKKNVAQKAGVPENFFDSAKTKAFLNLGKAPQKSILKNSGPITQSKQSNSDKSTVPSANSKAKGTEWTSSAPVLNTNVQANKAEKQKSPQPKTLLRTPSGGTINHLQEELDDDTSKPGTPTPEGDLPEGFFDDPVLDAKVRGV